MVTNRSILKLRHHVIGMMVSFTELGRWLQHVHVIDVQVLIDDQVLIVVGAAILFYFVHLSRCWGEVECAWLCCLPIADLRGFLFIMQKSK